MQIVTLARHAMATRFEIVLHGDNAAHLRAAGEEALDEIDRLESQLSLYRPNSEISRVNACAAHESVRVTPPVFSLLKHARQLWRETGGAFDIAIAPLVRAWGFMGGNGQVPSPALLADAREKIGMQHVVLDEKNSSIRFDRDGVMLDLGAIGKGYAIGCAAEILREAGVSSAFFHGGTSTVYAIGKPLDSDAWKIGIDHPASWKNQSPAERQTTLATISLRDEALSVSAISEKFFRIGDKTLGHVLDPRTGEPANNAVLSAVALPSATESDALSTALLVLGSNGHLSISKLRPSMRTLVVARGEKDFLIQSNGIEIA